MVSTADFILKALVHLWGFSELGESDQFTSWLIQIPDSKKILKPGQNKHCITCHLLYCCWKLQSVAYWVFALRLPQHPPYLSVCQSKTLSAALFKLGQLKKINIFLIFLILGRLQGSHCRNTTILKHSTYLKKNMEDKPKEARRTVASQVSFRQQKQGPSGHNKSGDAPEPRAGNASMTADER